MDVPHNFEDGFFRSNNLPNTNNIFIDKRVESLKHLKHTEREIISLFFKEAIMKGFVFEDIQKYIAIKTRLWIERPLLNTIKKKEERENREWFYRIAQDSMGYVGIYRKHIDEIDQYKKELWKMIDDPKIADKTKVKIYSELHRLSRTSILLLRDLPFISNLSRYFQNFEYDPQRE